VEVDSVVWWVEVDSVVWWVEVDSVVWWVEVDSVVWWVEVDSVVCCVVGGSGQCCVVCESSVLKPGCIAAQSPVCLTCAPPVSHLCPTCLYVRQPATFLHISLFKNYH
ncbi:hypothetical protein ANANG_G00114010, partial [Anguilla anguilla]